MYAAASINISDASKKLAQSAYNLTTRAIRDEDTTYLTNKKWWDHVESFRDVYDFAKNNQASPAIMGLVIRGMLNKNGFEWTFNFLVKSSTSVNDLKSLIRYKPAKVNLEEVRFGIWKKSVLHVCAAVNNLPWLRYFVGDLKFDERPACWLDSMRYGVLYYAAQAGSLEVAKYLVDELHQSPTQAANVRFHLSEKTPLAVATPAVKAYFESTPYVRSTQQAPLPRSCSQEFNSVGVSEKTPLLRC